MTTSASEPSGADPAVRQAVRADLLAIYRIESASFPQPWPFTAFEQYVGEQGFLVAELGASIAGFVVADVVPNHGRPLGHVKDLAVHPEREGEGVGSTLLERALAILEARDVSRVKLEVRDGNDRARSLYRRYDFEPLRTVSRYYDDGEDAVVMVRDAAGPDR